MSTPKILHIVGDSKFGGGSVLIARLAQDAILSGAEASVLTTDATFIEELTKVGVPVLNLGCVFRRLRPWRDIWGMYLLWRHLRVSRPTLAHTHTTKAGVVGRLAARMAGVPVVVHTAHGFPFHEGSSWLETNALALLERIAAHWCDALVTVSEFHCGWARRLHIGDAAKRMAIPNGIDATRTAQTRGRSGTRVDLGIEDQEFMFLSTARLARGKGLEVLIEAVATREETRGWRVVIAGDGEERERLEELVRRNGLERKVRFVGFRRDVGDLLAAADAVVLPSLREGLSIALLEAMAAGKVIIATDIGSNREACGGGECAVMVAPEDAKALGNAMVLVAEGGEGVASLGPAAAARYQERYTEARMLGAYRELYRRLLARVNVDY